MTASSVLWGCVAVAAWRAAHGIVLLAANRHQGIVPVSAAFGNSDDQIRRRATVAYDKYQHCEAKGALHLFATGW
jgi:hypothetical protein